MPEPALSVVPAVDLGPEIAKLVSAPAIGLTASAAIMRCAEQAVEDIETRVAEIRKMADDIERDGRELVALIQSRSKAFAADVERYTAKIAAVALSMRQHGNDVSTLGDA